MTTENPVSIEGGTGGGSPTSPRPFTGKRQLRNFLLDRLQLRYTAVMVIVSALLTAGLGYPIIHFAHVATETVKVSVMAEEPAIRDQVLNSFAASDRNALYALIGLGVGFCLLIAVYGIIITHKVAGPLHKIASHFARMKQGKLGPIYNLRKGDQLRDFFESFRSMHEALRQRTIDEAAALGRAISLCEQGKSQEGVEALRALQRSKEESTKS
jgi:hypothetical protein